MCTGPDAAVLGTTTNVFEQADLVTTCFARDVGATFIEATNGAFGRSCTT